MNTNKNIITNEKITNVEEVKNQASQLLLENQNESNIKNLIIGGIVIVTIIAVGVIAYNYLGSGNVVDNMKGSEVNDLVSQSSIESSISKVSSSNSLHSYLEDNLFEVVSNNSEIIKTAVLNNNSSIETNLLTDPNLLMIEKVNFKFDIANQILHDRNLDEVSPELFNIVQETNEVFKAICKDSAYAGQVSDEDKVFITDKCCEFSKLLGQDTLLSFNERFSLYEYYDVVLQAIDALF